MKQNRFRDAINQSKKAISIIQETLVEKKICNELLDLFDLLIKANMIIGKAYFELDEYSDSKQAFESILSDNQDNEEAKKMLGKIKRAESVFYQNQKTAWKGKLGTFKMDTRKESTLDFFAYVKHRFTTFLNLRQVFSIETIVPTVMVLVSCIAFVTFGFTLRESV